MFPPCTQRSAALAWTSAREQASCHWHPIASITLRSVDNFQRIPCRRMNQYLREAKRGQLSVQSSSQQPVICTFWKLCLPQIYEVFIILFMEKYDATNCSRILCNQSWEIRIKNENKSAVPLSPNLNRSLNRSLYWRYMSSQTRFKLRIQGKVGLVGLDHMETTIHSCL